MYMYMCMHVHKYIMVCVPAHGRLWLAGSSSLPAWPPRQCRGMRAVPGAAPCYSPAHRAEINILLYRFIHIHMCIYIYTQFTNAHIVHVRIHIAQEKQLYMYIYIMYKTAV